MTIGTVDRVKPTARVLAFGGVAGPATFVWSWARGGRATPGYSPFADHISELAAIDAPTRVAMTAGFVVYGLGNTGEIRSGGQENRMHARRVGRNNRGERVRDL